MIIYINLSINFSKKDALSNKISENACIALLMISLRSGGTY